MLIEQIRETQTTSQFSNTGTVVQTPVTPVTTDVSRTIVVTARKTEIERVKDIVWFIFGLIEVLLILRIIFLLLGARANGFAAFLYTLTAPFVAPFRGIFPAPAAAGAYFDSAAVLALIIYALLAWGATTLVEVIMDRR